MLCQICNNNISENKDIIITKCEHTFHCYCFMKNLSYGYNKCPTCSSQLLENINIRFVVTEVDCENIYSTIIIENTEKWHNILFNKITKIIGILTIIYILSFLVLEHCEKNIIKLIHLLNKNKLLDLLVVCFVGMIVKQQVNEKYVYMLLVSMLFIGYALTSNGVNKFVNI